MTGLIRSQKISDAINAKLKKQFPVLDTRKVAAYDWRDGWFQIYSLASLSVKERAALKAAGYSYYGRSWSRDYEPKQENEMQEYQKRVVAEKAENDERLYKLQAFITEHKGQHGEEEFNRMHRQVELMTELSAVLGERIEAFE